MIATVHVVAKSLGHDQGTALISAGKAAFSATHSVLLMAAALLPGALSVFVFLLLNQGREGVALQHRLSGGWQARSLRNIPK